MTNGTCSIATVPIIQVIVDSGGFFIAWSIMIPACRNLRWRSWSWPLSWFVPDTESRFSPSHKPEQPIWNVALDQDGCLWR